MSIDAAEALNLDLHKTLGASRNNPVIKVLVRLYISSACIVAMYASISKTRLLVLHSRSRRVIKGLHQGIDLRSTQHVEASSNFHVPRLFPLCLRRTPSNARKGLGFRTDVSTIDS